jgi:hypothetical protein
VRHKVSTALSCSTPLTFISSKRSNYSCYIALVLSGTTIHLEYPS